MTREFSSLNPLNQVYVLNKTIEGTFWLYAGSGLNPLNQVYVLNAIDSGDQNEVLEMS